MNNTVYVPRLWPFSARDVASSGPIVVANDRHGWPAALASPRTGRAKAPVTPPRFLDLSIATHLTL